MRKSVSRLQAGEKVQWQIAPIEKGRIMEMDDSLYIVVPAYNEGNNIAKFIEDWYPVVEKYRGGEIASCSC